MLMIYVLTFVVSLWHPSYMVYMIKIATIGGLAFLVLAFLSLLVWEPNITQTQEKVVISPPLIALG